MSDKSFLVCLQDGGRFEASKVTGMICPLCGGTLLPEGQMMSGLGSEEEEPETDYPEDVEEAALEEKNLLGDFILVEKLGEGGGGKVFKAWQQKLRRYVALKFLHIMEPGTVRRFEREAQLLAQLQHTNIAGVHEIGDVEGQLFLVMHHVDGPPIDQADLSFDQLLPAFVKICRAVDFAHTHKIIHRDIKPGNILFGSDQEVYVTDFGLARVMKPDVTASATGNILGTPLFMPPEQARGKMNQIDAQSDIYSLGATFYSLVTGRPPFEGDDVGMILLKVISEEPIPPRKIKPEIPASVEAIILKAMEKDKPHRYSTAGDMALDLENYLQGQEISARQITPFRRMGKKIKKNPWPFATATLLLLASLSLFFLPPQSPAPGKPVPEPEPVKILTWKERFEPLQQNLDYYGFNPSSERQIQESRQLLTQIPEDQIEEIILWFSNQIKRLPRKKWAKESWIQKRSEAKRIHAWCSMIGEVLQGAEGPFEPLRQKADRAAKEYQEILSFQGTIELQLLFKPYAEIVSLRSTDHWIIKEGRKKEPSVQITGEDFHTPLVIRKLDIHTYTLVITHPTFGKQKLTIPSDGLKDGIRYVYGGDLANPNSIRIRPLP